MNSSTQILIYYNRVYAEVKLRNGTVRIKYKQVILIKSRNNGVVQCIPISY